MEKLCFPKTYTHLQFLNILSNNNKMDARAYPHSKCMILFIIWAELTALTLLTY